MASTVAALLAVASALPSAVLAAAKQATAALEFNLEGTLWRRLFSEERGQNYFYNTKTGSSQWTDPRREAASGQETFITFLIFMLPFLTLVIAGGSYLLYIKMAHPDVLKPPKKSKGRYVNMHSLAAKKPNAKGDASAAASSPVPKKET